MIPGRGSNGRKKMTVLLVVALFAVVLLVEYFTTARHDARLQLQPNKEAADLPRLQPSVVAGFKVMDNVRYHPGHAWAMSEAPNMVRVGVDDFAAKLAGEIKSVVLPRANSWVRQGQQIFKLRHDGREISLCSPIEGTVVAVNPAILEKPSLVTSDPYGEGWLVTVQAPDEKLNFRNLIGGTIARRWTEDCATRLRALLHAPAAAMAQDGGMVIGDLADNLREDEWNKITSEFFLG
jgi:glycine cleavage system H protein